MAVRAAPFEAGGGFLPRAMRAGRPLDQMDKGKKDEEWKVRRDLVELTNKRADEKTISAAECQ